MKGDIDFAVRELITNLIDIRQDMTLTQPERTQAYKLLCQWDHSRGIDWYTSTKKWENSDESKDK